jgi:hypothetical protein
MAAPNALIPRQLRAKTTPQTVTSSWATVLANPADSGQVLRITGILASNESVAAAVLSLKVTRAVYGGSAEYLLVPSGSLASGQAASVIPTGENFNLEEGDTLSVKTVSGTGVCLFTTFVSVK